MQVDDGPVTTVDQYAASRQDDVVFYSSPPLDDGEHTAVVTVLGERHEDASDDVVAVAAAVVRRAVAHEPAQLLTVSVNDTATADGEHGFSYQGDWETSTGHDGAHEGDDHYSSDAGDTATIRFTGTRLALFGSVAPHHGKATVSIDGAAPVTVDQYAPERMHGVAFYRSPLLFDGHHTAVVTVLRTSSPGDVITVDRAEVTGTSSATGDRRGDDQDVLPSLRRAPTASTARTAPSNALDEQWDGSSAITTSTRPWVKESSRTADSPVSGGELKIPAAGAYHRVYYTERRFGGPGKPVVIRMRKRATNLDAWSGSGTIPSAAIWFRVPKDGVDKDDWRNAISDNDPNASGPSSTIVRDGVGTNGRVEVMAFDGMAGKYATTGSNYEQKDVGYTAGTERDVTIRGDWVAKDRWRWRVWHSAGHDMTAAPVHDWTGYAPHQNDQGFFAFRTDFLDAHYTYVTLEELTG